VSKRFALIGPGRVGAAISRALFESGYQPVAVIGRSLQSTREACSFIGCDMSLATTDLRTAGSAELILLAVPDDRIAAVALQLQSIANPEQGTTVLIHFSGVHAASVMRQSKVGMLLFSVHPLLPFADRQQAYERLGLAPYFGEGDLDAYPTAESLCNTLGGKLQPLCPEKKHLYHAAACLASNYLVTLIAEAGSLLEECGIERVQGETALLPLLEATLHNVASCGAKKGLTGPIVRGDVGTLTAHLQALENSPTDLLELYRLLGCKTVLLAESSGRLSASKAKKLRKILDKKNFTNKDT
jgi:predicted short-subunit dehydrogenase-like oxidoreductase (DUF2520 family)